MSGIELAKIAKKELSNSFAVEPRVKQHSSKKLSQLSAISSSMVSSSQYQSTNKVIVYRSPFYFANLMLAGLKQDTKYTQKR